MKSKEFFTSGQGSIPIRVELGAMGKLEVVVECVVSPRKIVSNDVMTRGHTSGSNTT